MWTLEKTCMQLRLNHVRVLYTRLELYVSVLLIVLQIWAQHRSGVFILFESQDLQDSKTATHSKDELTLSILIN